MDVFFFNYHFQHIFQLFFSTILFLFSLILILYKYYFFSCYFFIFIFLVPEYISGMYLVYITAWMIRCFFRFVFSSFFFADRCHHGVQVPRYAPDRGRDAADWREGETYPLRQAGLVRSSHGRVSCWQSRPQSRAHPPSQQSGVLLFGIFVSSVVTYLLCENA